MASQSQLSPEQQAIVTLQSDLAMTRDQVLQVTRRFDELNTAHQQLASDSDRLFREKKDEIDSLEMRLHGMLGKQKSDFELLDLKSMKPEKFKGSRNEPWKPWARRFKAYCNGKATGFRSALDWAERQDREIDNLTGSNCPWEKAQQADEKLHDFLCATLAGDAVLLVDTPGLETRGFECWRLLSQKYSPNGEQHEIDALMSLLSPKPAKDLASLGGALSRFEHDWRQYEKLTGESLPEKLKVGSLLKILPSAQASEIKWQMAKGLSNYSSMVAHIESYSAHIRNDGAYNRGDNDMDVSSMEVDAYVAQAPPEEQAAFYQGLAAGATQDDSAPPQTISSDRSLCALFNKGMGKGKGKSGKGKGREGPTGGGKDRGKGFGGQPTNPDKDKVCDHCLYKGHIAKNCRKKAAGEPATKKDDRGRPIRSLEKGQEVLDRLGRQSGEEWVRETQDGDIGMLERDAGCLDRCLYPLSEDFGLDASELFAEEDWVEESEDEDEEAVSIQMPTVQPGRSNISGPKFFSSTDPWDEDDPWTESRRGPASVCVPDSLTAAFEAQNATRVSIDLKELFTRNLATPATESVEVPPHTEEPGAAKLPKKQAMEVNIGTPSPPKRVTIATSETGSEGRIRRFDGRGRRTLSSRSPIVSPSVDVNSNILCDFPIDFHALQPTSSECIFGSAQNATLPNIDPSFLTEEGRKDKGIGNVGCKAGVGKGRRTGMDSSGDDCRNGGTGSDVGVERDIFGRPISEVDGLVNLEQSGQALADRKNGVFETSFSFSKSSNFADPLTQNVHDIHDSTNKYFCEIPDAPLIQVVSEQKPRSTRQRTNDNDNDMYKLRSKRQPQGRNAAEISAEVTPQETQEIPPQQTQESSDGTPVNSDSKTWARRRATRRARRLRASALRFIGGTRRHFGVQVAASTRNAATQTDTSLPQRVDVVWQSHMISPSTYVDKDAPDCEEEECDIDDHMPVDDEIMSANDPRREQANGQTITALDSLESEPDDMSDDSFFNFDDLDYAEAQEEIVDDAHIDLSTSAQLSELPMPLRRCRETIETSDIDSDGDVIPAAEFSSTDDETSTNARIRRHDEKRRVCRRVKVHRAVSRIEESEQHPSEFEAPVASKEEKARCLRLGVEHMRASTAKERGVAGLATAKESDTPMTKTRSRQTSDRPMLVVATGRTTAARKVGGTRMRMSRGITVDSGAADNVFPRRMIRKGMRVRQSEASRQGVHYVAADGVRIANEGEMDFKFQTKEGCEHSWTFQVAAVNKVLASVSALVDSGHRVVFEKDRRTGVDLSFITNVSTGKSIRMNRERNVWTIDTFVNEEPGFSRPE